MGKEKNTKTLMACRYCFMCRHVCTSGILSSHESDFPRGRALILYSIMKENAEYDTDTINSIYNCFMCGSCMAHCEGGEYSIPDLMKSSRIEIVNLEKEPETVKNIRKSLIKDDNPYDIDKKHAFKIDLKQKADVLYYMGPDINYKNHEIAEAVIEILKKAEVDYSILKDEPACGKTLNILGYISDAKDKAKSLYTKIKNTECKILVVSCPVCYDAFKNDYPEWGFELEPDIRIYHLSEYLTKLVNDGKIKLKQTNKNVTITDSEYLGIFNDLLNPPRELVKLCSGENFVEMNKLENNFLATGETAFIFRGKRFNDGAQIGQKFYTMAKEANADQIVTLSAIAKNNIKAVNGSVDIVDISEFVNELI
jgi:Fe-S oxidoreductase